MSKSSKPRKSTHYRPRADRAATIDIVSQLECAAKHPQATLIGALIGGVVPWFARTLAHEEVPAAWSSGSHGLALIMLAVVLGCACFSALTVYKFGRAAFNDTRKALGFVLAIEGVMLVSHGITSAVALAVLILINAVANGSVIALAREATCKQHDAVRRAAETRAKRRPIAVASPVVAARPMANKPASQPVASRGRMIVSPARLRWMPDVVDAEIVSEDRWMS